MSLRPCDWTPLADRDPVPGDPYEVGRLARRISDTAEEMTRQAAALRRMADYEWDSDAGDEFKHNAESAAKELDKVHGRYTKAGSALSSWVDPLARAQSEADGLLAQAQSHDQDRRRLAACPPVAPAAAATPEEQHAYQTAKAQHDDALAHANCQIKALQDKLATVVSDLQATGKHVAHAIRDGADSDGLKNSWWQGFVNWVDHQLWWLKPFIKILSWVATVLAVAALFCSGIGFGLVPGFMVAALLGDTLLALTGNGSWLDVVVDAACVATFGAGTLITRGAKVAEAAGVRSLVSGAEKAVVRTVKAANVEERAALVRTVTARSASKAAKAGAKGALHDLTRVELRTARAAVKPISVALKTESGIATRVLLGSKELAEVRHTVRVLETLPSVSRLIETSDALGLAHDLRVASLLPTALVTPPYLTDLYNKLTVDVLPRIHLHLPTLPEWKQAAGGAW